MESKVSNRSNLFKNLNILSIYSNPLLQIVIFAMAAAPAFTAGMISSIGVYVIPILDKASLMTNLVFYFVLFMGAFAILRSFSLFLFASIKLIITMPSEKYLYQRLFMGLLRLCAGIIALYASIAIIGIFKELSVYISSSLDDDTAILVGLSIVSVAVSVLLFVLILYENGDFIIFAAITFGLAGIYLAGFAYMEFQQKRPPDFVLVTKGAEEKLQVNIIFKSLEGVLVIDKSIDALKFYPWDEVKMLALSELRNKQRLDEKEKASRRRKSQFGIFSSPSRQLN
jgi:hypothetical protein